MGPDFTKRKFLSFSKTQQHKKCAELLRQAYEGRETLALYNDIAAWMELASLTSTSSEALSDRYHTHAKHAALNHKEHHLLPSVRMGDKTTSEPTWDLSIYLDNIRSAHNVGSIIRTTEAFSLGKVYFSQATPFATHKQVQDAAMGATPWVECLQNIPLEALPHPILAMETADTATSIFEFSFPQTFTLVMGNEEYGCSEQTLKAADAILEIPLRGRKNSLNVANAFAIAAAEIYRQRIHSRSSHGR